MLFKKGATKAAIDLFAPTIELSQREPGCLKFAVHQDIDDPDVLVVVEQWESKAAHDTHLKQPHVQELNESVAPLMAGVPRISVGKSLEIGDPARGVI